MQADIVHPNAAGLYAGSKSHFVWVGQKPDQVNEFGTQKVEANLQQEVLAFDLFKPF